MTIYDWPFGTLPFRLFGSNLDTRDLETYPRTYSGHFWNMSIFDDSRAIWVAHGGADNACSYNNPMPFKDGGQAPIQVNHVTSNHIQTVCHSNALPKRRTHWRKASSSSSKRDRGPQGATVVVVVASPSRETMVVLLTRKGRSSNSPNSMWMKYLLEGLSLQNQFQIWTNGYSIKKNRCFKCKGRRYIWQVYLLSNSNHQWWE